MHFATLEEIRAVAAFVGCHIAPTPQYKWPLLNQRFTSEIWVKHENHTPIGSFKIRGGLNYIRKRNLKTVVTATRGNHGQSVAYAAATIGAKAIVIMPRGNSKEKNDAMKALGAELIEHGDDFDDAKAYAQSLATDKRAHYFPSIHSDLIDGVSTYALELFEAVKDIDAVYVPIGLGSGICGIVSICVALGYATSVIGVVAENADAYAQSFEQGASVQTSTPTTIADGLAVRVPDPDVLKTLIEFVPRVVRVSEAEIAAAMRHFFTDTHNVVEGAGAAALAAALKEDADRDYRRIAVIATGGNVDAEIYRSVLNSSEAAVRTSA